jgi:hypothetical protein
MSGKTMRRKSTSEKLKEVIDDSAGIDVTDVKVSVSDLRDENGDDDAAKKLSNGLDTNDAQKPANGYHTQPEHTGLMRWLPCWSPAL